VLELGEDLFDRVQVRRVFRHRYLAIATLECAILGTTPSSSVLCAMELADYLRDQAVVSATCRAVQRSRRQKRDA
jgi:hypothetical protein